MNVLWSILSSKEGNGLDEINTDKMLKKIATKDLGILTFKRLDSHIRSCAITSKITLIIIVVLALEKSAELLHIKNFTLPSLGG